MTDSSVLTLILVLGCLGSFYTLCLIGLVCARMEKQPVKIKSPKLMLLSIFANLFIIISVSAVQLSEEKCVNKTQANQSNVCNYDILQWIAVTLGYMTVAFSEPLAVISYVLRAFRLRRIFDAQIKYFKED